jgi:membrane protease YdiL (CAAX protease family)
MPQWLQYVLHPEAVDFTQPALWQCVLLSAPLVLGGLYAILKLARRLGPAGGAISVESFLFGVPLALAALMLTDLALYLAYREAYVQNRASFSLIYGFMQLVVATSSIFVLRRHRWELQGAPPRLWTKLSQPALFKTAGIWLLAVPVIAASMLLSVGLTRLMGLPIEQQRVLTDLTVSPTPAKIAGAYVMAVLGVPLAEELAFRVVLFGGLRGLLAPSGKGAGVLLAYALSIALFVFAHGVWKVDQLYLALPLTTLSIALTLVYDHSRSIWPCVMFHALHNALVLTLQFTLA